MSESYPMSDASEKIVADPLHLGSRLGTLEQEVSGLKTDIGYIRQQVSDIANSFNRLLGERRTDWTALATWGAVIVAILVAYSTLSMVPYDNYIEATQERDKHQELSYALHMQDQLNLWKMASRHDERITALKEMVFANHELDVANHTDSVNNFREIKSAMFNQDHRWTRQDHTEYSRLIERQIQSLYNIVHNKIINEQSEPCPTTPANK